MLLYAVKWIQSKFDLSWTTADCCHTSLRGRRSKGKGKGIRARDHARGRREAPYALSRAQIPPSPLNACHAGYCHTD